MMLTRIRSPTEQTPPPDPALITAEPEILMRRACRKGDALTFPIRYYRPARPRSEWPALLWAAPGLLLAGSMIAHLFEAAAR